MVDTRVSYMGLELRNPIVVSSSSLTNTPQRVMEAAQAGAGAVVLKSLFEEEILAEIRASSDDMDHTEAYDYIQQFQTDQGISRYTTLIRESVAAAPIPVIASVNAVSGSWWAEHIPAIERAGAHGLELNIALMPDDYRDTDDRTVAFYVEAVQAVRAVTKLPIAVKIGYHFTSIPALVDKLTWAGAAAVVLFNRFYQLDIDVESLELRSASPFSSQSDLALPLRWLSLLSGAATVELAASSGIHDGDDVIKAILAGANVAQVCSTLYRNGVGRVAEMVSRLEGWMNDHHFDSVAAFRGKLSRARSANPSQYERLQYIKALVGRE